MKQAILLAGLLVAVIGATAQSVPFDKEHIPNSDQRNAALDAIKQGDKLFGTFVSYPQALAQYEKAYAVNPDNADLNLKIGLCHLNGRQRYMCMPNFEKAVQLEPGTPRVHYLMGYAYQLNGEWDKAVAEYQLHKENSDGFADPDPMYNTTERNMVECRNGRTLSASPVNAQVENLGAAINSPNADYGVLTPADGSMLMFTSRREGTTGGKLNKFTGEWFEDIYTSRLDKTSGAWSAPANLPAPVNTVENDASVGLFNDGRTLLIYRDVNGNGDIWETTRTGDSWSQPVPLGPNINTKYHESSAWFSYDRQWLFFVSDRPETGLGGQDIYRSQWDESTATWGQAENLGPDVNTIFDEDGVFVHPDGKTIHFSSRGHNSMGGYDIFTSTYTNGFWSKARNLGWPINGPDDDLYFVLTADGQVGYFSSVRSSGLGEDDIYRVRFMPDPVVDTQADMADTDGGMPMKDGSEKSTVLIKGHVVTLKLLNGMEADIEIVDVSDASVIARFKSDGKTGEFMAAVPAGRRYAVHMSAPGFLFHSEHIDAPTDGSSVELTMDVSLQPIETGRLEVMRNLFFAKDKADLDQASLGELGQLIEMLRQNPEVRLEIGGHTDSDGSEAHNTELSERRAQAVVDHLITNGIIRQRLVAKGYGPTQPLAANDSSGNKAKNRRTEIRVLAR
ncbi:MAG: OmpA family protein [Flavobacteriales bacterium]